MKLFTFLLVCQSLVALNDSIVRFMLLGLASVLLTPQESSEAISLIAFILILPYLLMAPLAGWISDRFAKSAVIRWTVAVQLLGLILLSIGIWIHSWIALYTGFGLLAVQSAFFSPAKKGILKELIGGERLGLVIGIAELFTVFSILMGGWLGGWGFEFFRAQQDGSVWAGAGWTTAGVGLLAMGSFLLTFGIEKTKPQGSLSFSPSIIFRHFHDLRLLWQNPALFWCACSIALVWGLGYFLTLVLMNLGKDMAPETAASTSGGVYFMARFGGNIRLGIRIVFF